MGFGAGAHSFLTTTDGVAALAAPIRFASPRDINAYIAGINCVDAYNKIPRVDINVLSKKDILNEQIMLGLRLAEGVDEGLLMGRIPAELQSFFVKKEGKIALNDRGMEVMNGILVRIMDF